MKKASGPTEALITRIEFRVSGTPLLPRRVAAIRKERDFKTHEAGHA